MKCGQVVHPKYLEALRIGTQAVEENEARIKRERPLPHFYGSPEYLQACPCKYAQKSSLPDWSLTRPQRSTFRHISQINVSAFEPRPSQVLPYCCRSLTSAN
jgi:hypothetical protein